MAVLARRLHRSPLPGTRLFPTVPEVSPRLEPLEKMDAKPRKLGLIGTGKMAQALAAGWITKGVLEPKKLWASSPDPESREQLASFGCNVTPINADIPKECDVMVLAVKPNVVPLVLAEMTEQLPLREWRSKIVLSVAAGVTLSTLGKYLGEDGDVMAVRIMTNTAVGVGCGSSAYALSKSGSEELTEKAVDWTEALLSPLGLCLNVPESNMDAIVALSGSGIAFLYVALEALSDAGVKMGLPRTASTLMAVQTMRGASEMAFRSRRSPAALKEDVCSPGGTTIYGIHALEKTNFRTSIIEAVEAATMRSMELGRNN